MQKPIRFLQMFRLQWAWIVGAQYICIKNREWSNNLNLNMHTFAPSWTQSSTQHHSWDSAGFRVAQGPGPQTKKGLPTMFMC